ncbi:uncharacterized protein LOC119722530 [Patiria miniata]|uniref:Uncharacterized protein n=1 Tax=Patiria miniata TaxID=46514 RepID=A0A913ZAI7_PATMI|nr:uncharacterized protein LOC119722530 [Patiria miniata]
MKYVGVFVLSLLGVIALTQGAPDCLDTFTAAQCAEYMKTGGAQIVLPLTEIPQLDAEKQAMLKYVLANVSDEYVIVDVEPKHVLITNIHLSADNGNRVAVDFFVANPTGSVVMPVSFRTNELYLVLKLNKEKIDDMLDYKVTVVEPDSANNLPIPTWALAIIVYAALVIVIGLIYYGTKDFRRQWSEAQDKKLRHAVLGDSDMELDPEAGEAGTGQGDSSEPNGPAKMYRDSQISFGVQVTKDDIEATLGITYATVESKDDAKKEDKCLDSPPPEKSHKPPDYHEATAPSASDSEASSSDTASKKSEASSAIEGAVNAAYEADEQDGEGDQTTSL